MLFEWVENNQRLVELVEQWRQQSAIALDTEFIRTRTFYPEIGLLQIADEQGVYLLDPLALTELQPLKDVFNDTNVVKVLHSCSEDLDVFQRYLQTPPAPLFDTQIAAGFAGYGASLGYASLIETLQGETIPKQETRSDWLQRPLSDAQLHYAALDVHHLLPVYYQLQETLQQQQRLAWLQADCQQVIDSSKQSDDFAHYYLRIKSAWKLRPHQLAVLRDICAWREQEARTINIPRNRLVKDVTLWAMAQQLPKSVKALRQLNDVHPRFVEKYGEHCIQLIQSALDNENVYPEALPRPLDSTQTRLFKQLKERVVAIAESLRVPPEFLVRKKELEQLVRQADTSVIALPANLQGWRQPVIAQPLIDHLVNNQ